MKTEKNVILDLSFEFALKIIEFYKKLTEKKEFVISKQILRSGTSIGANIEEAQGAQSKKDFINKMSVAYKEARETNYWLRLLEKSSLTEVNVKNLLEKSEELMKIISSIITTTKNRTA